MMQVLILTAVLGQAPLPPLGEAKPLPKAGTTPAKPKVFVREPTHPDIYMVRVIEHLRALPAEDRLFTRFLCFNTCPDDLLDSALSLTLVFYNTLNSSNALAKPVPVGKDRRLYAIDLRNTRWTVESFAASVRVDQTLREPFVDPVLAEEARRLIGVQQDPQTFHVDVMAPGMWFVREMMEAGNRTDLMYNLLYSEERFGKTAFAFTKQVADTVLVPGKIKKTVEVPWEGGVWPEDGKFYPKGSFNVSRTIEVPDPAAPQVRTLPSLFVQQKVSTKVIKNFPENVDDFQERWGVKDAQKTFDKLQILGKNGEIVVGARNASGGITGSIVSTNDRIIEILVTAGGKPYMRTKDFLKTSGARNPLANLRDTVFGDLQEDAGEHIVFLPHGMPANMLSGAAGAGRKRVEAGDAEVVSSRSRDPDSVVVKNQISCFICHGPQDYVMSPSNRKIVDTSKRGVQILEPNIANAQGLQAFIDFDKEELDAWRLPFKKALRNLLGRPEEGGWSGEQLALETIRFRAWYDAPVGFEQASAELGVPRLAMLFLLLQDAGPDAQILFSGGTVPRAEWDDILFRKLALLYTAARDRENPNPLLSWLTPSLLRSVPKK